MAEASTTPVLCSGATRGNAEVVYGPAPNPHANSRNKSGTLRGFFCGVCGERVTSQTEEQHSTSTLHIFNQRHKPSERKVPPNETWPTLISLSLPLFLFLSLLCEGRAFRCCFALHSGGKVGGVFLRVGVSFSLFFFAEAGGRDCIIILLSREGWGGLW